MPGKEDRGAVLVLWVFALPALIGFVFLVITAGSLVWNADSLQAASDSGALSGSVVLHARLSALVASTVQVPESADCSVTVTGTLDRCADYAWLDGYYIYEPEGWLQITAGAPGRGQIGDTSAFADLGASWSCTVAEQRNGNQYCLEMSTGDAGTRVGALGDGEAVTATDRVVNLVESTYGVSPAWGACGAPPPGFWLPEAWAVVTCVAYRDDGTFWVELVSPGRLPVPGVRTACLVRQSVALDGRLISGPLGGTGRCPGT